MSHGGGAAGSASGDEAAGLAQRAVHQVPGAVPAAQQTHPAGRDPRQGHAGKSRSRITHNPLAGSAAALTLIFDLLTHCCRVGEPPRRFSIEYESTELW